MEPLQPEIPTSVQPGGAGLCTQLELAWGRWRRTWLRRFRPAYVRRMAEKRQGHCENCRHDIIDARDLKHHRNVCGYSFRPEDDRFAWRERIPLARPGLAEVTCFSFLFLTAALVLGTAAVAVHPLFWIPFGIDAGLWLFVISFFRDPHRVIPVEATALVSPADGTITHVGEVEEPDFPGGQAFRISIFLSVFNVHVNRSPRTATVTAVRYFRGCFLDARDAECARRNEQLWIDFEEENPPRVLRVKQIAGAIARRIVCWLKPGDVVQTGERFGMIKFGSRTDVLLPAGEKIELLVKVGDKVKGGSTVLLHFKG
jgi:phosphatidylserine decarboxylase